MVTKQQALILYNGVHGTEHTFQTLAQELLFNELKSLWNKKKQQNVVTDEIE